MNKHECIEIRKVIPGTITELEADAVVIKTFDSGMILIRKKGARQRRRWSWTAFTMVVVPALILGTVVWMGFVTALLLATGAI